MLPHAIPPNEGVRRIGPDVVDWLCWRARFTSPQRSHRRCSPRRCFRVSVRPCHGGSAYSRDCPHPRRGSPDPRPIPDCVCVGKARRALGHHQRNFKADKAARQPSRFGCVQGASLGLQQHVLPDQDARFPYLIAWGCARRRSGADVFQRQPRVFSAAITASMARRSMAARAAASAVNAAGKGLPRSLANSPPALPDPPYLRPQVPQFAA